MKIGFNHIPGQSKARKLIKNLLKAGRVPHALLITGRTGVGKKDVAMAFASALMCFDLSPETEPCGKCTSCRRLISDANPDLFFITPDGETIRIDQLRNLISELKFKPTFSKNRVIILENAEKMSEQAANAILKTLEEPPPQNIFILLSNDKHRLLSTIVSRCCHIKLEPLSVKELERIASEEKQLDPEKSRVCAFLAGGSLKELERWSDEDSMALWDYFIEWAEKLPDMPMWQFFGDIKNVIDNFDPFDRFTYVAKVWLMLLIRNRIQDKNKDEEFEAELGSFLKLFEFIEESEQNLQFNVNKVLTAESIGLSLRENLYGKDSWC